MWMERAAQLNLQWVANTPRRNDEKTLVRCLDCGNEWMVTPANIAKGRKSCEPCARQLSRISTQEWKARLSAVRAEWVGETPDNNSDKSKVAKCLVCGGQWNVDPRRISKGHPRCSGKLPKVTISESEWLNRAAKAGIEWLEMPTRSKVQTGARCLKCGHRWKPIPDNIRGGSGCPKCALKSSSPTKGVKITPEEWGRRASLLGLKWRDSTPLNAHTKSPIMCLRCGHEWLVWPTGISKGASCPSCAQNARLPQAVWDERASKVGLKWLEPVSGRHAKVSAICLACGHSWSPDAGAVAMGAGCPICSEEKRRQFRLLGDEVWERRADDAGLAWLELPDNNATKKRIRCKKCSYEWSVIPQTIASGAGCPVCSGVFVEPDTWMARALAVGVEWLEIPTSARRPTRAKCLKCGLIWKANPGGITSGSGCPDCAETGYKVGQPGLFYLVERTSGVGRPARKIGITNIESSKVRLSLWRKQGFVLRWQKTHTNGQVILDLETNMLRWLRYEMGLPQYLDKEEMPKGGATETFSPDEPDELTLIEWIEAEFLRLSVKDETG